MKSRSVSSLGALALACALIAACGNSEEDVVPQMNNAKPAKTETAPAPAPAEEEPQLVPIQSLSEQKDAAPAAEEAKPAQAAVLAPSGDVKPLSDGPYVIQVSIQPSKKAADGVVKKLSEQGIEAYVVEVENPGELEGTYYRVRVGYFSSIKMAQDYGKQVLSSLNFAWWVDNSSNDHPHPNRHRRPPLNRHPLLLRHLNPHRRLLRHLRPLLPPNPLRHPHPPLRLLRPQTPSTTGNKPIFKTNKKPR